MIRVDDNVINVVEKIRKAIKNGGMSVESFPSEAIHNLIECTLGSSYWDCVGSKANYGFQEMPEIYKERLQDALDRGDIKACERLLYLFECSYVALYSAMSEDEIIFRQKPYRKMIIDMGSAYAQLQYRLHKERQKELSVKEAHELTAGRGVVYTCMLDENEPSQPKEVSAQLDYICFTTMKEKWGTKEGVWQYRAIENKEEINNILLKNQYKIMIHEILPEYDYSIWVDSEVVITGDIFRFCKVYGDGKSFLGFVQSSKDCIYQDMSRTGMGTDDLNITMRKKICQYQKEGYPEHNGLIDSRIMVRNHRDDSMRKVMEEWWNEIQECPLFEGNTFNYVAWKNSYPFSVCDLFLYENPYFVNKEIDLNTNDVY